MDERTKGLRFVRSYADAVRRDLGLPTRTDAAVQAVLDSCARIRDVIDRDHPAPIYDSVVADLGVLPS